MFDSLESRIKDLVVEEGSVACVWIGQAGYILKSPGGVLVFIDPYLSEYALQQWNMPRKLQAPIDPEKIQPDMLLASHWHEDHLDQPLIRTWAKMNPGLFLGPVACSTRLPGWGWPKANVSELPTGATFSHKDVSVTACFARHEVPSSPSGEAVSFLFQISGVTLWFVCDTEYDARLRPMTDYNIDVAFTPINGVGGNLTDKEAALLMTYVKPKLAVPCHYNMWEPAVFGPGATLDPQRFVDTYHLLGGGAARILEVGALETFRPGIPMRSI